MRRGMGSRGFAAFAGAMVAAGPVMAACSAEPSYEGWAATDGAAGRINLDDVQDAFKKSESATEFEDRVNKIYEGDGVVLIRVEQDGDSMTLDAFEDLDGNGEISDSQDDLLFSIVEDHDMHEMRGYGANGYYHSSFGGGNFLFTYLLLSTFVGPRYSYYTTPVRSTTIRNDRSAYRKSAPYRSQVSRNTSYFSRQKSFHGSRYDNAGKSLSQGRQTYQASQKSSGAFRTSAANVRGASRFGGGLMGGGGGQVVVGRVRSRR